MQSMDSPDVISLGPRWADSSTKHTVPTTESARTGPDVYYSAFSKRPIPQGLCADVTAL